MDAYQVFSLQQRAKGVELAAIFPVSLTSLAHTWLIIDEAVARGGIQQPLPASFAE